MIPLVIVRLIMTALINQRHELFALGLVEGKTADQAYTDAGYKPNRKNASRLKTNEGIQNRVAELQVHHQQRHDVTVDTLTTEYEEARDLAMNIEQPSAAISATSGKAKLHGFDKAESVQVNIQQNVKISKLELARRMMHIIQDGTIVASN